MGILRKVVEIDAGGHRDALRERRDSLIAQTMKPGRLSLVEAIARQIARNLPPCFDLEDLIGAGQIALISAATLYRAERGPWIPFARMKVRGGIIDSVRRRCGDEMMQDGLNSDPVSSPSCNLIDALDWARRVERVKRAIAAFPQRHRAVMEALYFSPHEPSMKRVAEDMGCSEATIHGIKKQALAALRVLLNPAA